MRKVRVLYHRVLKRTKKLVFPEKELAAVFLGAGIILDIAAGKTLKEDPERNVLHGYSYHHNRWKQESDTTLE